MMELLHVFIILLVSEWLYSQQAANKQSSNLIFNGVFTLVLVTQSLIGLYAINQDYKYPFSEAKATSDYIVNHE